MLFQLLNKVIIQQFLGTEFLPLAKTINPKALSKNDFLQEKFYCGIK